MDKITTNKITVFIKKYLGELLTIIGIGVFSYNAFNFYHTFGGSANYYYYSEDVLMAISVGAMLIAIGIMIMKHKTK